MNQPIIEVLRMHFDWMWKVRHRYEVRNSLRQNIAAQRKIKARDV